jgi:hypothetical protein
MSKHGQAGLDRRHFLRLAGAAAGAAGILGISGPRDTLLAGTASGNDPLAPDMRRGAQRLVVKPILTYELPSRREAGSWRNWGQMHDAEAVERERTRIDEELAALADEAGFGMKALETTALANPDQAAQVTDLDRADVAIIYAAGGPASVFDAILKTGKPVIFFIRHETEPYYLWHEIVDARFLRAHSDQPTRTDVDHNDVVVDNYDELRWRLAALYGLTNTVGRRILAVGGPGGWATREAPDRARERWGLDMQTVEYADLEQRLKSAQADASRVRHAVECAAQLISQKGISLETKRDFVVKSFILTDVFRQLLEEGRAHAITVNGCMGRIMPMSQTAPCLTLNSLNDAGYMAYCESDFVVIPAGILMHFISGKPTFLCNPTYPHDGTITFAHCTAPRRMNGRDLEPARIVTHFESDYGAAPKVQFRKGQTITALMPDFGAQEWVGYRCEIADHPFLPICRSQIEARIDADQDRVIEHLRGFHHMLAYGDYLREVEYALKKVGIGFVNLSEG